MSQHDGIPDFPIDFKNEVGASLPKRSLFTSSNSGNTGEYLIASEPGATGDEALFVTEPREIADDGYGHCRSIFQGPFWVRYEGSAPAAGDTVGPVASETYVDGTGSGFKVLAVDEANEIVLCAALGGGGCDCITVIEIKFEGSVTGGTVIFDVGIDDGGGVDTENVTLNFDDTASEVQTAFEGHSSIAASGADITVKGGPLPGGSVYIVFKSSGNLNREQPLPTVDTNSLTGTNVVIKSSYMTNADWEA